MYNKRKNAIIYSIIFCWSLASGSWCYSITTSTLNVHMKKKAHLGSEGDWLEENADSRFRPKTVQDPRPDCSDVAALTDSKKYHFPQCFMCFCVCSYSICADYFCTHYMFCGNNLHTNKLHIKSYSLASILYDLMFMWHTENTHMFLFSNKIIENEEKPDKRW